MVQIQPVKHVLGHAGCMAPTRQRELDRSIISGIYLPCLADRDNELYWESMICPGWAIVKRVDSRLETLLM